MARYHEGISMPLPDEAPNLRLVVGLGLALALSLEHCANDPCPEGCTIDHVSIARRLGRLLARMAWMAEEKDPAAYQAAVTKQAEFLVRAKGEKAAHEERQRRHFNN